MTPKILISELLDLYPEAEDVLFDHGFCLDDSDLALTLGAAAREYGLDAERLLVEVSEYIDDAEDDDTENWELEASWMPMRSRRTGWS